MGLTERHWFENEEPGLTERQLEDAVSTQDLFYRRGYQKGYSDGTKEQNTKTGYWITEEPNAYTSRTYCSVCGESAPFIYVSDDYYGGSSHGETKKTKYCPNCGAKMET